MEDAKQNNYIEDDYAIKELYLMPEGQEYWVISWTKDIIYLAGNIKSKDEISQLNVNDYFQFDIQRNISLGNDIKTVWQLYKYFKRMKFDAVHSVTPKAGMTTAIAAKMAGIKHRTHIFTGQVWATRTGIMRWLLKSIDKITATLDNHILVDGESQRQYIIKNGVVSEKKSQVLGPGSISGVNTDRFTPSEETRINVRKELNINERIRVIGHVGRFDENKNQSFILDVFVEYHKKEPNSLLILIGKGEMLETVKKKARELGIERSVKFLGVRTDVHRIMQAFACFIMPSKYEGLPFVLVEAQCSGLFCVVSDTINHDAKITKNIEFIPLRSGKQEWCRAIEKLMLQHIRTSQLDVLTERGYSIGETVKFLEKVYEGDKCYK